MRGRILCIWFIGTLHVQGQDYFYNNQYYDQATIWEAGAGIGLINCLTDLGGHGENGKSFIKDLNIKNTRFCGGLYTGILQLNKWGLRFEASYGKLTANDSVLKGDHSEAQLRYERNLHFQTNIIELLLSGEIFPLAFLMHKQREKPAFVAPYLAAGIGLFYFNPKANLDGNWVSLRPLHTEGQGFNEYPGSKEYKRIQILLPVGLGLRFELGALVNARIEIVHRFLFTDYLDDVSTNYIDPELFYKYFDQQTAGTASRLADRRQELNTNFNSIPGDTRGHPGNRDSYFSVNLKLGFVLNRNRRT